MDEAAEPTFWKHIVGEPFAELVGKVQALCPPDHDPMLANRTATNRRLPLAGQAYHRARIAEKIDDTEATENSWQKFVRE